MKPRTANTASNWVETPPERLMQEQHGKGQRAAQDLRQKLRAVGTIFGQQLGDALCYQLEAAQEFYEDALHCADQMRTDYERAQASANERGHALAEHVSRLNGVVIASALEIQRRYAVGRNEVPAEYQPLIEVAAEQWSWIYPPADPRHEHHFDSAGACEHPCCHQLAPRFDEEPF